jgi:hypothetical protein
MKKIAKIVYAVLALGCFALSPKMQAVSPAPDGGYPGFNTAEGQSALLHLTTGTYNTAVGWSSLGFLTTGSLNTGIGAVALLHNTGDQNTATGAAALLSNTNGNYNTASGGVAMLGNTTGTFNSAFGQGALYSNTTGNDNTAIGAGALFSSTTANGNTATGFQALPANTTGNSNTAIGYQALFNTTTGSFNTALGVVAGDGVTTASNVICIGAIGHDIDNSCYIANIRGVTTQSNDAIPVLIDSTNQLGTASSSRRYKTDIKPINKASESILALKPVSFRYKIHKDATPQYGLIAEQVAEVNPNLVIYDADGKPYTVRYDAVNAMLLNEFLKAHRTVQEQGATITQQRKDFEAAIAQQQKEIESLAATVKQQAAQIQKVNAQREVSKPAPQTVLNNQ